MTAVTYGVDEAGRGPILGPLSLAVVALDRTAAATLQRLGVSDSKGFGSNVGARRRRAELDHAIRDHADAVGLELVDVETIDRYTYHGRLNVLEREVVMRLLEQLVTPRDATIICDGQRLFGALRSHYPRLSALDGAEAQHVSVAAASIVAKHARDEAFAAIAARYETEFGPIRGGGYLNAATRRFLAAYDARYGGLPPEARKSWGAGKRATAGPDANPNRSSAPSTTR